MTAPKAKTNGQGPTVDLNAAHRARRDQTGDAPVVALGKRKFTLPRTMPAAVLVGVGRLQEGRMGGLEDVLAALFGVDNVAEVLAAGFEVDDLEPVLAVYGYEAALPESSASGG